MALMTGFVSMHDPKPSIGTGSRVRGISEAGILPDGPGHAVAEGDTEALCGTTVIDSHQPWPPGPFVRKCSRCLELAPVEPPQSAED